MSPMNRFVSVLFLLFVCLAAGAQRIAVNPKFGAVSDAEVDMTVYEPDTSAVALMLYRSYDLDLVFDSNIAIVQEITVHERIKVLKEEGKKYADFSFLYLNTTDIKEKYSGVKVETYNRENGKVVKTKMSKKYQGFVKKRGAKNPKYVKATKTSSDDEEDEEDDSDFEDDTDSNHCSIVSFSSSDDYDSEDDK